ncbi:MAG: cupredoxin domain-containing protein [Hahellaceae bacterium]|nr:cupredoxin domain-containing protein [Hahellaceae bacterium]
MDIIFCNEILLKPDEVEKVKSFRVVVCSLVALMGSVAAYAEVPSIDLIIENHRFSPEVVEIAAGQKVKLHVINKDATPEEFESHDLRREKVIAGNASANILIGPLEAGEYSFVGEFNEDTAKGKIIVK